jgi:sugar phosphate isomerase/epimerase
VQRDLKVRRRLGLQILFDFSDITDCIGFAVANRFGALELNLGNIEFGRQLRSRRERERIRLMCRSLGLTLAFHALEGPSFFIPSARVRRSAIAELKRTMDWAGDTGAVNVVMHLGFDMHYGLGGANRYTHEQFPDYYEQVLGDALSELKQYAAGRCRLCVENVGGFRYDPARPVLAALLGGSLGLCFDVGHVNILPPAKKDAELAFFRRFLGCVHHAHIHDNHGARDEHLALGEGRVEFVPFFRLLARTDALLVFETRPKEAALGCLKYYRREIEPRLGRAVGGRRPAVSRKRSEDA